ncbi:hypothetical protein OAS39_06485 [Pirellulales bacterium]|nr:hypothetical protein [Pirellulales bacterium]
MAAPKIDFKASSWDKAKPKDIKGTKLSAALKAVEKALADEKRKKDDPDTLTACLEAMEATSAAAQDSIKKECDAKKHKDVITALKKFDSNCAAEIKRLQDAVKAAGGDDDDGDVSDGDLFSQKMFKDCIKKAKLKSSTEDGVSFCLGVHKKAEDCKLVFMKKKKFAMQIFKRVVKVAKDQPELGLKRPKMTYGAAYRDAESKETLVLHIVDGAPTEIPGMARKIEKWRKKFKQDLLPFKELSIRGPSGKPLEMTPDPDEDGENADTAQGAAQEAPAETQAETQEVQPGEDQGQTQEVGPGENAGETQEVQPGEDQPTPAEGEAGEGAAQPDVEDLRKELKKCRQEWQQTKEQCIQNIEAVKDGIRNHYLDDPQLFKEATSKLGQLDAIMDNLSDDLRDVLDKYVSTPRSRSGDLETHRNRAKELVSNFLQYAGNDPLLNAIDEETELADANLKVKEPVEKSLRNLLKTLG